MSAHTGHMSEAQGRVGHAPEGSAFGYNRHVDRLAMRRIWLLWLASAAFAVGCGSSSFTQGDLDATSDGPATEGSEVADAGEGTDASGASDAASTGDQGTATDGHSSADGSHASDASPPDDSSTGADAVDVYGADGACNCQPYWCGCGACDPSQIACTVNPPVCARGCASSCPELAQTTCACSGGRCVRGGIDASSIGCVLDTDCPAGDCCARAQGRAFCTTAPSTCCSVPCP
jgi:hypothetical protein